MAAAKKQKLCGATTIINGVRVKCLLKKGHHTAEISITHHEHWFVVKRGKRFYTRLLTWFVRDYDYNKLQAEARGTEPL